PPPRRAFPTARRTACLRHSSAGTTILARLAQKLLPHLSSPSDPPADLEMLQGLPPRNPPVWTPPAARLFSPTPPTPPTARPPPRRAARRSARSSAAPAEPRERRPTAARLSPEVTSPLTEPRRCSPLAARTGDCCPLAARTRREGNPRPMDFGALRDPSQHRLQERARGGPPPATGAAM